MPILAIRTERCTEPLKLIGSGTLVKIGSSYQILTVAHVWDATELFPILGLIIADRGSPLSIRRDYIQARRLRGIASEESGPDLALLALPASDVSEIRAHKSFLDLMVQRDKCRAESLPQDFGVWAVTGMVEGFSNVRQDAEQGVIGLDVQGRVFFGAIDGTHERDGYDYLEVGVKMKLAGVPSSFGGVSGGSLWQIVLLKNKTGQIFWGGEKYFQGVAFWQSEIREGRRVIRCHGRRSLFDRAWNEWRLSD